MENNKNPNIRFKGFTDPWEQRKAKNLFVSTADKGHPELPVLSATQDRGMIRRDENSINIYHDKKNEEGYKRVLPGQFVIHLRSFQGGFAHSAIEGITSPAYTVFGFSEPEKHNPNYWKYVFTSKEFIRRLETVTYGIRDGRSISYDEFLTMDFVYPTQDEQTKIANYLDTLDNLITLHQRKYNKLLNVKKSMLEKMFPKNGSNIPEIRFKGFTDPWEQRKWIDTVDISTEMVDPTSGEFDDMPHIAPGNIESFTGRILDNVKSVKEEQLISGKFRFRPGDVVYGKINPQLGKYFYASVDGLTSADAYVFNGKNGISQKFLFSLLQTADFFKYSVSVSKRSGMPKINRDELNAYSFLAPNAEEQNKIGDFLLELDHLITLHQRELEKLQNIKKSMLEKMFV